MLVREQALSIREATVEMKEEMVGELAAKKSKEDQKVRCVSITKKEKIDHECTTCLFCIFFLSISFAYLFCCRGTSL